MRDEEREKIKLAVDQELCRGRVLTNTEINSLLEIMARERDWNTIRMEIHLCTQGLIRRLKDAEKSNASAQRNVHGSSDLKSQDDLFAESLVI